LNETLSFAKRRHTHIQEKKNITPTTTMMFTKSLIAAVTVLSTLTYASPAFGRGPISSVFAVPRGGGLFGGKEKEAEV
jgi:K+-transporting ATPase A subunit